MHVLLDILTSGRQLDDSRGFDAFVAERGFVRDFSSRYLL